MTQLRDYILSKLQEQLDEGKRWSKAERSPEGVKAINKWKTDRQKGRGVTIRVAHTYTGDAASTSMNSEKLRKRGSRGLGQTKGGMDRLSNIWRGYSPDARQDASTDLRTQLTYVLADKLEELSQETMDNAARKRTAQLRDKNFRGETVPIYRAGTGGTANPEQIDTRNKPGKGVILARLQGRKATADKPAKKSVYQGKITPGATGKEARAKAANREDSSTILKNRMVDILMETYYRRGGGYGGSRRRRETPKEREERENYEYRDNYWSGRTDSQGNDAQNKIAPGGSDEGHKDSKEGHR
jgi:hypothetical protein